ncbi:MAG: hypothetical protein ROZ64_08580 [Burkholderiaceae bacterium]|nr:hypothetical protein [Burkholderiaceae bacterium]
MKDIDFSVFDFVAAVLRESNGDLLLVGAEGKVARLKPDGCLSGCDERGTALLDSDSLDSRRLSSH